MILGVGEEGPGCDTQKVGPLIRSAKKTSFTTGEKKKEQQRLGTAGKPEMEKRKKKSRKRGKGDKPTRREKEGFSPGPKKSKPRPRNTEEETYLPGGPSGLKPKKVLSLVTTRSPVQKRGS